MVYNGYNGCMVTKSYNIMRLQSYKWFSGSSLFTPKIDPVCGNTRYTAYRCEEADFHPQG